MTTSPSTRAFIAQMKLRELRVQRDALQAEYDTILQAASLASTSRARVEILYEGLRKLRLAGEPVHTSLSDLTVALRIMALGGEREADAWEHRLRAELEKGRVRSEAVYVFGGLLEEATSAPPTSPPEGDRSVFLEKVLSDRGPVPPAIAEQGLIASLFDNGGLESKIEKVRDAFGRGLGTLAMTEEERDTQSDLPPEARRLHVDVESKLVSLAHDRERPDGIRREAKDFLRALDAQLALSDAIEMILAEAVAWRWPREGVSLRAVQTADRVRFHPDVGLVPLLVLEQVGEWFKTALPAMWTGHVNRRRRLDRLIELNAPEIIIRNERRMLEADLGLLNDPRVLSTSTHPGSVAARRDLSLAQIHAEGLEPGGRYGYAGSSREVVRLVNAEIAFRRRRGRPVFLVRTDLADFFPSLDHRVILGLLQRFGVSHDWCEFIQRFLEMPVCTEQGIQTLKRGVPLGFTLSRVLADLVLCMAELHVRRAGRAGAHEGIGVLTVRAVDDIVLLSDNAEDLVRAWRALESFIRDCGLEIQPSKTGSVAVGAAETPVGLPAGDVRWNVLWLTSEGWRIHDPSIEEARARTTNDLKAAPSLLSAVQVYNSEARYLVEALLADSPLGWNDEEHVSRVAAGVEAFTTSAVEGGTLGWLRAMIESRWSPKHALPTSWFYWPITAGGLGLYDPLLAVATLSPKQPDLPDPSEDEPELASVPWGTWYGALTDATEPAKPREDALSKALVEDFIRRGGELRGEKQEGLSTYWRWVLATHGPGILETFGTYRFLLRKLVPLDLIRGKADEMSDDAKLEGTRQPSP